MRILGIGIVWSREQGAGSRERGARREEGGGRSRES